jgi:LuxR family transcriptional regulator, maltose regulon positive regulatory protein
VPSTAEAPPGNVLVRTKLTAPRRRDLVLRPALIDRLAFRAPRRLTVVRAPAGWGKSTLLAAWADGEEKRTFAWLQLDAGDDQPIRFWTYVTEALRAADPNIGGDALALVTAPGVDLLREALPLLLNDLADLEEPIVLVLDDYHLIESPEIQEQLTFFCEHLPGTAELAIATRTEPALPLGRLRARGELTEIDAGMLRFSAAESSALLNDVLRLGLRGDQVEALHRRTEGWAAALYLAALSLRDRPDQKGFIDAFAGDDRQVVDYLGTEVLAGLSSGLREFMMRTSILDGLESSLCDAVAGPRAGRLLAEIERSNVLLIPLDDRREWYRYHHLFADLLRLELERAHPGLAPELHRRAAAWHLARGDADRAIRHTIAAGDEAAAAELAADHWTAWLLTRGDHGAIDAWLRLLPDAVVRSDSRLCVAKAFVGHSMGRLEGIEVYLEAGDAALGRDPDPHLRAELLAARASHSIISGDVSVALEASDAGIEHGDPASPWHPVPYGARAHALRWHEDTDGALDTFHAYMRESEIRGQPLGVVSSLSSISLIHAERRQWPLAREVAERALELTQFALGEHWMMSNAHIALALLAWQDGEPGAALESGARAIELARRGGVPGDRANALLTIARLHLESGDAERAERLTAEARALLESCRDPGATVLGRLDTMERAIRPAVPEREPEFGEELSERELAVLRLMATDLSQREIGERLYVSLNTVKTHARHIYRKLGASGREETVARAREARLI